METSYFTRRHIFFPPDAYSRSDKDHFLFCHAQIERRLQEAMPLYVADWVQSHVQLIHPETASRNEGFPQSGCS